MSKESNNSKKKNPSCGLPGGIRALANSILEGSYQEESTEIVSKTQSEEIETKPTTPDKACNGLVDFRDFLEEYKNVDSQDRHTAYLTSETKDVLDKLKASKELKRYSLKEILNSIIHAYVLEHKKELVRLLSNKNNILD